MRNRAKQNLKRLLTLHGAGRRLRRHGLRSVVALLGIFAIVLQGFVVQAHIHNPRASSPAWSLMQVPSPTGPAAGTVKDTGDASGTTHGKFSGSDDTSNCRLCQELVHAGRFVAPLGAVLTPPLILSLWLIAIGKLVVVSRAGAYVWRSRAPPLHS